MIDIVQAYIAYRLFMFFYHLIVTWRSIAAEVRFNKAIVKTGTLMFGEDTRTHIDYESQGKITNEMIELHLTRLFWYNQTNTHVSTINEIVDKIVGRKENQNESDN